MPLMTRTDARGGVVTERVRGRGVTAASSLPQPAAAGPGWTHGLDTLAARRE
jgi:hypothetical protein